MKCKVVILNWNGREHLTKFLPSVVAATPESAGIVVVDNGSDDDSCPLIENNFPSVELLRLDRNYGYAGGYNKAVLSQYFDDCDCLVLLNSDVETPAGWIEPLLDKMEREPGIAALAPKILSYNNKTRFEHAGAAGGFIDAFGYPFCRGRILSTIECDKGQYDDARYVFWASGACLVVRTDAFRELGGFDSDFFAHMEEIDFCWRAQLAGWRIAIEPRSRVYHLGAGTLAAKTPRKIYLNFRNTLFTLYKNLSPRSRAITIFTRMFLDGWSAFVYLVSGRPQLLKSVWQAHRDYRRAKPGLKIKRREIMQTRKQKPRYIYRGSILLRHMFGMTKFGHLI